MKKFDFAAYFKACWHNVTVGITWAVIVLVIVGRLVSPERAALIDVRVVEVVCVAGVLCSALATLVFYRPIRSRTELWLRRGMSLVTNMTVLLPVTWLYGYLPTTPGGLIRYILLVFAGMLSTAGVLWLIGDLYWYRRLRKINEALERNAMEDEGTG